MEVTLQCAGDFAMEVTLQCAGDFAMDSHGFWEGHGLPKVCS